MYITYFDADPQSILFPLTFWASGPLSTPAPAVLFNESYFWMGQDLNVPTVTLDTPTQIIGTTDAGGFDVETRFFGTGLAVDDQGNLTAGTISGIQIFDDYSMVAQIDQISWDVGAFSAAQDGSYSSFLDFLYAEPVTFDASQSSALVYFNMHGAESSVTFTGGLGSDSVLGSEGNDTIFGNDGNDTIYGEGGDDLLLGGAGNDQFFMTILDGNDTVNGGAGDQDYVWYIDSGDGVIVNLADSSQNGLFAAGDVLINIENVVGTSGNDTIIGDANNNFLQGLFGQDMIIGGNGNDTIVSADAYAGTEFHGGNGNDVFYVDRGNEVLFDGGAGWDTLDFTNANEQPNFEIDDNGDFVEVILGIQIDLMASLSGSTQILSDVTFDSIEAVTATRGADFVAGDARGNRLIGREGNDTLEGRGGNDVLIGGQGADSLSGGQNEDRLFGGTGNDTLYGDAGHDLLQGDAGNDVLFGGSNADNLLGGAGNDILFGEAGFDRLFGGDGDDIARGGTENDALFGQDGDDTLNGQWGDDRVFGGFDNDLLGGGTGNDALFGGAGFDTLNGDTGNDLLSGNFNADLFVFTDFGSGFGQDTITDFAADNPFELIDLSAVASITNLSDLIVNHMVQAGSDVVISDGRGNTITLQNVQLADVQDGNDFVF